MSDDARPPLADSIALKQLAHLRQRSLSTPRYRDAAYVRLYVTPRYHHWSQPSVFDPQLEAVRRSLSAYERLAKQTAPTAGDAWREVIAAVDLLLNEGRHRLGHRVRPKKI